MSDASNADGITPEPLRPVMSREMLETFSREHPRTAALLQKAQAMRERRLLQYAAGARLNGFEELLEHLEKLELTFASARKLKPIAFLIGRAPCRF
jgi:hypothetical protein